MPDTQLEDEARRVALDAFRARHADVRPAETLQAGSVARVERLDRAGSYLLVPIRDASGLRGIVQLDAVGGEVESSAAIGDPASTFLTTPHAARAAAERALPAARDWGEPFLGWRPSHASFDSMRPLWVVPHKGGRAFVTQTLRVVEQLTSGRGG